MMTNRKQTKDNLTPWRPGGMALSDDEMIKILKENGISPEIVDAICIKAERDLMVLDDMLQNLSRGRNA